MAEKESADAPDYTVPALAKALDILELLANQAGGLNQGQIAEAVGRSIHQIYRVLQVLERRGYIFRSHPAGLYYLSTRMFELAHRHDPLRGLVEAALPAMRCLSNKIRQSCNLGIHDAGRVLIVAQIETPEAFGFRVRLGAHFPLFGTATGRTLMAFRPDDEVHHWLVSILSGGKSRQRSEAKASMIAIRKRGYEEEPHGMQQGVVDLAFPIIGSLGQSVAALTVPYIATDYSAYDLTSIRKEAAGAAEQISKAVASELEKVSTS